MCLKIVRSDSSLIRWGIIAVYRIYNCSNLSVSYSLFYIYALLIIDYLAFCLVYSHFSIVTLLNLVFTKRNHREGPVLHIMCYNTT